MKSIKDTATAITIKDELQNQLMEKVKDDFGFFTTYELQKSGIDSRTYTRILNNPEVVQLSTLIRISSKLDEMKKNKE